MSPTTFKVATGADIPDVTKKDKKEVVVINEIKFFFIINISIKYGYGFSYP